MPTLKPRVQVTLEPSTHEVIERLAFLQGCSRGAVISGLIDSVAPALGRTVALLEAAREAPSQIRQGLIDVVQQLHGELVGVTGEASKEVQLCLDRLNDPAWQPPTSGSVQNKEAAAAQAPNPRVVTRGSGIRHTTQPSAPKRVRKGSIPGVVGCTCVVTKHERQENPECPVHHTGRGSPRG